MFVVDGELRLEYSSLLLKHAKVTAGRLPIGKLHIAMEMHTERGRATPAER
jgi:hypothetical protein